MFKSSNSNRCLCPGGYWRSSISKDYKQEKWYVWVADFDDESIEKSFSSLEEAKQAVLELCLIAPFDMSDLKEFGYTY